ncbi:MAG: polysaccharide deacetylase family protein [Candidatus Woesearchaeota archaeon]
MFNDDSELSDIVQGKDEFWNLDKRYDALSEYIESCDDEETLISLLDYVDNKRSSRPKLEQKANKVYDRLRQKLTVIKEDTPERQFSHLFKEFEGKGENFFYSDRLKKIKSDLYSAETSEVSADDVLDLQLLESRLQNSSYLRARMSKNKQLAADFVSTLWVLRDKIDSAKKTYARNELKKIKDHAAGVDVEQTSAQGIMDLQNIAANMENDSYIKSKIGKDTQIAADFISTLWTMRDTINRAKSQYDLKKENKREEEPIKQSKIHKRQPAESKSFLSRLGNVAKAACIAATMILSTAKGGAMSSGESYHPITPSTPQAVSNTHSGMSRGYEPAKNVKEKEITSPGMTTEMTPIRSTSYTNLHTITDDTVRKGGLVKPSTHLDTDEKIIALTFDACGGKGYDSELVDYLKQEQIPATMFLTGRWIKSNPEAAQELAHEELFSIQNHGESHRPLSFSGKSAYGVTGTRSQADALHEIDASADRIEELTGNRPTRYRPGTGWFEHEAKELIEQNGNSLTNFDVVSGDHTGKNSAEFIRDKILTAQKGSIVVMHMHHPNWNTKEGLELALPELRRQGYTFVKLD